MEQGKIHLVCSSGGVKCFSYLGAISRFYAHNIKVASISACSMGTVMGVLIASGLSLKELENKIINFDFTVLKTKKFWGEARAIRPPFASHRVPDYGLIMQRILGEDLTLSQLKIPFSAVTLDIRQKRFLVYSSETHPDMKVSEIVKIATSVPLMHEPYKIEKHLLVDAAIATESPVWMAVNQKGNYPIVVLKVSKELDMGYRHNLLKYLGHLIGAAAESNDYFTASQITRNIDVNINCENIDYTDFNITSEQIESLILQGEAAAEQQLKEFNYDFDNILRFHQIQSIQEIKADSFNETLPDDSAKIAANLAESMISSFKNEIINRNQIFVSYSHLDKRWLEKLNTSLSVLERFSGIKAWSDKLILSGKAWNEEITRALSSTKVAVFLVSDNFLASPFIQENEMNYFLEVNKTQNVPILWISISSSNYHLTPLKDIQCANDPTKPLDSLSEAEQNFEITKVCRKISEMMQA